ncbi:MAG: hypothetical protein VW338_04705 [Rhodospirillaceae bacterium]
MATLYVNFSRAALGEETFVPVPYGPAARSEMIDIGGTSEVGDISAAAGEDVIEVYADTDCWIQIGAAPVATAGELGSAPQVNDCRFLPASTFREYAVDPGHKIAVIAAS